jgi:hypothetical protein
MNDKDFKEFLTSVDQLVKQTKENDTKKKMEEEFNQYLLTPKDITSCSFKEKATILTLHFIGYLVKPIGIEEDLYKLCLLAFCENRGKIEIEENSVYTVIKTYYERQRLV